MEVYKQTTKITLKSNMEPKKEKIFAEGMFFSRPREGAPDFVKGAISIKCKEFYEFMKKHVNPAGYVNLDLKVSKGNKLYLELNSWTKEAKEEKKVEEDEDPLGGIPF